MFLIFLLMFIFLGIVLKGVISARRKYDNAQKHRNAIHNSILNATFSNKPYIKFGICMVACLLFFLFFLCCTLEKNRIVSDLDISESMFFY